MTISFKDPILARCTNRNDLAKENPIIGNPENWFNAELLRKLGFKAVTFDFFINWATNILDRNLWLKRPTQDDIDVTTINDDEVISSLKNDRFLGLVYFARTNNFTASAIVYNDNQNWDDELSSLLHIYWPKDSYLRRDLRLDRINLKDIKQIIREKSGGAVSIGSKGLSYGTSNLECYLSRTDALWPGDADLVLLNHDFSPFAVLEFKKHTNHSVISFDNQTLNNYYPNPDGRKYNRLKYLCNQMNQGIQIPLFIVYFSVIPTQNQVIIENISGEVGNLKVISRKFFDIDPKDINGSTESIIRYISNESKK